MNRALAIILRCSLALPLVFGGKTASSTSLYQCVSETEGMIYTDNPAQLESCSPITETGAVTSLATSPSVHPPMTPPNETPLMTPLPSEPFVFRPRQYEYATPPNSLDVPQSAPSNPLPCPIGLNPLNPFSAPPCQAAEPAPPSNMMLPPTPSIAPTAP